MYHCMMILLQIPKPKAPTKWEEYAKKKVGRFPVIVVPQSPGRTIYTLFIINGING